MSLLLVPRRVSAPPVAPRDGHAAAPPRRLARPVASPPAVPRGRRLPSRGDGHRAVRGLAVVGLVRLQHRVRTIGAREQEVGVGRSRQGIPSVTEPEWLAPAASAGSTRYPA